MHVPVETAPPSDTTGPGNPEQYCTCLGVRMLPCATTLQDLGQMGPCARTINLACASDWVAQDVNGDRSARPWLCESSIGMTCFGISGQLLAARLIGCMQLVGGGSATVVTPSMSPVKLVCAHAVKPLAFAMTLCWIIEERRSHSTRPRD